MKRSTGGVRDRETTSLVDEVYFTKAIEQTRWIFSLIGVWTMLTNNITNTERRISVLVHIMCQSLLLFIVAPTFFHLYWAKMNVKMKMAVLGPAGVALACLLKCLIIIYRRQEIKGCIEQIEDDWRHNKNDEYQKLMLQNVKKGKNVTTICAVFMYTGGMSHQMMIPFLPGSILSIVANSSKRMLVYPVYDTLFDTQSTSVYFTMYLTHVFTGIFICGISVGACHLSILFLAHISGQNNVIILKMKNLIDVNSAKEQNMNAQMREIIEHHCKIINIICTYQIIYVTIITKYSIMSRFSYDVEKSLREMCLVCIMEALYIICTAEYYAMTAWRNNETFGVLIYFILVEAFILNCFIFCHVGELAKKQFYEVGEAAYMTNWHTLSLKNARAMLLIVAVTQKTPKMTAGGLMELSHSGFVSVLKTTAAYFNIMRMVEF